MQEKYFAMTNEEIASALDSLSDLVKRQTERVEQQTEHVEQLCKAVERIISRLDKINPPSRTMRPNAPYLSTADIHSLRHSE